MSYRLSRFSLCCWVIGLLAMSGLQAAEYRIVLPEQLNHRWTRELVTYPFTAAQGACVAESVRLSGPQGALPVQLAEVEHWPGTAFVKSAKIAFVVDELAPLATNTYTVSYGPTALPSTALPADLAVKTTEQLGEMTTSRYGVRMLLGEKTYDPPVAATTVPGPIQAMRLTDGSWFGGSRLYGDTQVAGYTARITERGPALARAICQYRYADGNTLTVTLQLNAQGDRVYVNTAVAKGHLADGWDVLLTGLPPLAFQYMPEQVTKQPGTHMIKGWKERAIADYAPGLISKLVPWAEWTDEFTQSKLFLAFLDTRPTAAEPSPDAPGAQPKPSTDFPDARELVITRLDAGAWVTPPSGAGDRDKASAPLLKAADGTLYLRVNNKVDTRVWTIGESPSYQAKLARVLSPSNVMQDELEDLNVVKEMIFDWPATIKHPALFLNAQEMKAAGERNPAALRTLQNVQTLRQMLGSYVFFDTMRGAADVICIYDAVIDSDLITPAERKLLRAQMAYLAYRLASPANWSTERGYNSGNPNMTVAHTLNQGLAACVLADHPMAKAWSAKPVATMDGWMNAIDSAGHWPESSGYARVSESKFIFYAIAAQRAGLHDFLSDPRFKRMVMYYERTLTPPDPQRVMGDSPANDPHHPRVTPTYGRGGNANSIGLGGVVAKATATIDPAFSRIMQWSYARTYFSTMLGEPMAGYDQLLTDPTLPTEQPEWRSELLPSVGALFRSGVGTPEENYLLLVTKNPTNPDGEIWPSEVGALELWFEHGKPLTRMFPAYPYENYHGLLANRVMLATNWAPGKTATAGYTNTETLLGFATLPRVDYISEAYQWHSPWNFFPTPPAAVPAFPKVAKVGALPPAGQPPVTWQRQALYVRDALPGGMNYLVLRDTVTGGQPTQWQFWTLSKQLIIPGQSETVVEDGGQPEALAPRAAVPLTGNRFTAIGQFGLDLDYYVASPTDTPRHTLRYNSVSPVSGVVRGFPLEQDLLHLQLPGDGCYFVTLVPRDHAAASPAFATLGDGTVIKVTGAFGTDYHFLTSTEREATADKATFHGTAASVQDRPTGLVLALAAPGAIRYGTYGITAPLAASLQVSADTLSIQLPATHTDSVVTLQAPAGWRLATSQPGVTLQQKGTTYQLTIQAKIATVILKRK
ncbi:MAG: hypothetical protein ACYDBB_11040 [Armatimonadota bacterium]